VIHGKAYKPDVPYCIGSYSTLIGHYIKQRGFSLSYVDPLADDRMDCIETMPSKAVVLLAHNRQITYGYTGSEDSLGPYAEIHPGSIIVDPWRKLPKDARYKIIHYGNSRS